MMRGKIWFWKLAVVAFFVLWPNLVGAATCPDGLVNDPYPGDCGKYVDQNKDGLCDLSQKAVPPAPPKPVVEPVIEPAVLPESEKNKELTSVPEVEVVPEVEAIMEVAPETEAAVETGSEMRAVPEVEVENKIEAELKMESETEVVLVPEEELVSEVNGTEIKKKLDPVYDFFPVVLGSLLAYGLTYFLAWQKIMSLFWHRRIWNWLLLFTFLTSALSGVLLILKINYGFDLTWWPRALYFHVETGLAMAVISVFHIGWHWRYYACGLGRKKVGGQCDSEETKSKI